MNKQQTLKFVPERMARTTDPSSSHEAAKDLIKDGGHSAQLALFNSAVNLRPGCTARELAFYEGLDRYNASRRLPELERMGLVRKGEIRKCKTGGKQSVTWWPALGGDDES